MINNENSIQLPQKHSKKALNADLTGSKHAEVVTFYPTFKWLWRCSNVVGTSSNVFGKVQNSSENGRKSSEVTVTFSEIPVLTRRKAHAFDSEKVGGYTFNLEWHWVKGTFLRVNVAELTEAWLIE